MSINQQIECAQCQWDTQCIKPPTMTKEDIEAKIKEEAEKSEEQGRDKMISGVFMSLMIGGKDKQAIIWQKNR